MQLTHAQKSALVRDGFVRVPGVAPRVMVDAAVRAINHDLGQGMDPALVKTFNSRTFCPGITSSAPIVELFSRTPALALAESAIGAGRLKPVGSGQIALRFPVYADPPKAPWAHVDGIPSHDGANGLAPGIIANFAALACVLLSDLSEPMAGNFTVWPGTHRANAEHLRRNGVSALLKGLSQQDLPEPVQITGRAGDLILAHYLLAHGAAQNISPHVRYACFFRLETIDDEELRQRSLTDEWILWHGMREIVDGPNPKPQ